MLLMQVNFRGHHHVAFFDLMLQRIGEEFRKLHHRGEPVTVHQPEGVEPPSCRLRKCVGFVQNDLRIQDTAIAL